MKEWVILVDEQGNEIGACEKMEAHIEGKLHRAFSIFIFNSKDELMIQRRASSKYHSGDLWSNTCCSHPRPGESLSDAAHRRLKEEMGFDCELEERFNFTYQAKFNRLIEHEYDHVFIGRFNDNPQPNQKEFSDWKWIRPEILKAELAEQPEKYTVWLNISFDRVLSFV